MQLLQARVEVNRQLIPLLPGGQQFFDDFFIDFQQVRDAAGDRYTVFLHPKRDIEAGRLSLYFRLPSGARPFCNGYQSWSASAPFFPEGGIPSLRRVALSRLGNMGDDRIRGILRGPGRGHSWTYTHASVPDGGHILAGSVSEKTGLTFFEIDMLGGQLTATVDLGGMSLTHSFPMLDLWVGHGTEEEVFDRYFSLMERRRPPGRPAFGWTSWYRHFTRISEKALENDLMGVASSGLPFEWFQVDDGWQPAVGDWDKANAHFPSGMAAFAANVKVRGLKPGLWLAPFVVSPASVLAQTHPDWLLKGANGRPLRAGWNPLWGGWYQALDFYHPGVREHLAGVFHRVLHLWGYEMVKLDFLFAAGLRPPAGKTGGQVVAEAMEFIHQVVGSKAILACGVPLGAAFGLVDYCRTGPDVHLSWEHRLLAWLRHRERLSTLSALRTTLGRWQLSGRAFGSDLDVFILRSTGQKLTPVQQNTLLLVNVLLGNLCFTSDDVGAWTAEEMLEFEDAVSWRGSIVREVMAVGADLYRIDLEHDGRGYAGWVNLSKKRQVVESKNGRLELRPFETLILGK